jgi:hypothetical protein
MPDRRDSTLLVSALFSSFGGPKNGTKPSASQRSLLHRLNSIQTSIGLAKSVIQLRTPGPSHTNCCAKDREYYPTGSPNSRRFVGQLISDDDHVMLVAGACWI